MLRIVWNLGLLFISTMAAATEPDDKSSPVQSPTELLAEADEIGWAPVTVRFRVGAVGTMTTTYPDGSTFDQPRLVWTGGNGTPGNSFYVGFSPEAADALRRIGIHDLEEHFVGKTVTVHGYLGKAGMHLPLSKSVWFHNIAVNNLDQFQSVDAGETSGDDPPE